MIILICKMFKKKVNGVYTNKEELLVDYAIDMDTGLSVIVPNINPQELGGRFNFEMGEWVLED